MKPTILDRKNKSLEDFKKHLDISQVIDVYKEQLEDLFLIRNPQYKFNKDYHGAFESFYEEHKQGKSADEIGEWVYFPWNKLLVHYLSDELHQEVRTARNKNLITKEEQANFYNYKVGIAGLSVGSHAALTLGMMGASKVMKLADPDTISASNLNRIRYDYTKVGVSKCALAVEQIYQMNPYAEVYDFPQGITDDNIHEFLSGIDVLVEEMDNLEMKIRLRLEAKKMGIPVIMATDNGDNIIVDIERYDLDPDLKIFNGVAGDLTLEEFQKFPPQELPKLATKIAGADMVMPKMMASLLEVGRTLYSWPQLGDAATLSGVAIAYLIKRMANGEKIRSGKLEVNLDSIFDPDYHTDEAVKERDEFRDKFQKTIGLK